MRKNIGHSTFEQVIQKQIKQNIDRYGKCWFFFDSEYYRYLQSETSNAIRLNLDWFIKYIEENLLKVFSVSVEGKIKHLSYPDLIFLKKFRSAGLEKRKISILSHVLQGYGYTSTEIHEYFNAKRSTQDKNAFVTWLRKKEQPDKIKKLGYVIQAMSQLEKIDDFFFRENFEWNRVSTYLSHIGVLDYKQQLWSLEDYFDILQYFPEYIENELFWNDMKHVKHTANDFIKLISGQ